MWPMTKVRRGCYLYRGLKIERYTDGDLKGWWDIVLAEGPTGPTGRTVTGPFPRLKAAKKSIDQTAAAGGTVG